MLARAYLALKEKQTALDHLRLALEKADAQGKKDLLKLEAQILR